MTVCCILFQVYINDHSRKNLNEICNVGAQKVNLPNSSKMSFSLSLLTIILRFQACQRYMITNVVFFHGSLPSE